MSHCLMFRVECDTLVFFMPVQLSCLLLYHFWEDWRFDYVIGDALFYLFFMRLGFYPQHPFACCAYSSLFIHDLRHLILYSGYCYSITYIWIFMIIYLYVCPHYYHYCHSYHYYHYCICHYFITASIYLSSSVLIQSSTLIFLQFT